MSSNDKVILSQIPLGELETTIRTIMLQALSDFHNNKPQADPSDTEMLTVKQVSKLLGISEMSIHQWKKDGKIKFHRFGSRIRFKKSDVLNMEKYKGTKNKRHEQ